MGCIVAKFAFFPPPPSPTHPFFTNSKIQLTTKRGHHIPGFHFRLGVEPARFTVIFSHGNATDIEGMSYVLADLGRRCEVDVLLYEYSGYANTTGAKGQPLKPSESYCYENITAAFDYLTNECEVPPNKIILFGQSLGTGATIHLGSKKPGIAGVVVLSPLLSAIRVVWNTRITLPFDLFANINKVGKIRRPVFIIHGTNDTVINVSHGKKTLLPPQKSVSSTLVGAWCRSQWDY